MASKSVKVWARTLSRVAASVRSASKAGITTDTAGGLVFVELTESVIRGGTPGPYGIPPCFPEDLRRRTTPLDVSARHDHDSVGHAPDLGTVCDYEQSLLGALSAEA
jgi:hypothetical protein